MRTKIIPFDIELAKKIQSGEVEGRIKCNIGEFRRILCFDAIGLYPVVALLYDGIDEVAFSFSKNGYFRSFTARKLFIELPEEAPKQINVEQLTKLKEYVQQLMDVNQSVIDDLDNMVGALKSICNKGITPKHEFKPFDKVLVRVVSKEKTGF